MKTCDPKIDWNCPICGFENTDYPLETVFPVCGGCGEQTDWIDIFILVYGEPRAISAERSE